MTTNLAHISAGQVNGLEGLSANTAVFNDLTATVAHISSGQISGMTGIAADTAVFADLTASTVTIHDGTAVLDALTATSATILGGIVNSLTSLSANTAVLNDLTATVVAIMGGSVNGLTSLSAAALSLTPPAGQDLFAIYSTMALAGGTNRWFLYHTGDAPSYFGGNVVVPPGTTLRLGTYTAAAEYGACAEIRFANTFSGIQFRPDADTAYPCVFRSADNTLVGSIVTSATATTYTTTSDVRLKHAIAALGGALDVVAALRPVRFKWNADDSADEGFLAHELQQVLPRAVTGEPDAVNEDGSVKPQGVDHSRLVPWLTAALQEAVAQMQALTARVASLEEQLGV